jgi:hypothetical protein
LGHVATLRKGDSNRNEKPGTRNQEREQEQEQEQEQEEEEEEDKHSIKVPTGGMRTGIAEGGIRVGWFGDWIGLNWIS